MRLMNLVVLGSLSLLSILANFNATWAQYEPKIAQASNEGEAALKGFQIPNGMKAELFAAEPLIANPVAFCIDEQGRFYVAETFRQKKGVEDNRSHMNWLHDDLALQTVEERVAMFKKHLGDKALEYTKEHDRIRLLTDTNGDGKADKATVFVDGFNDIADGTGAGVLAVDGDVYYTCIPKVWKFKDNDNDGVADTKTALHHGYGVRVAFRGHDLHGLTMGPDGRVYFSIGDRGYNIETPEGKHLVRPDTGAVFRCERDGSALEVFAYGLRNPQELAFDNFGDLFTCDNNSDSGDKARWVHIVEGSDTGWRMYFQYLKDRGPWNREKMWHPYHAGQPAHIVPPITNLADGPSGLVFYPGVGLPARYDNHFFLCDFRGGPGRSGIRSFATKPNGATHELTDSHQFIWKILGTDIDFGYDGSIYVSDWVNGWDGLGKGRIYKFTDLASQDNKSILDARKLIAENFSDLPIEKLLSSLSHQDRRVRFKAQYELARRAEKAAGQAALVSHIGTSKNQISRLHAVWALGQSARHSEAAGRALIAFAADRDVVIRAQTINVLGEAKLGNSLTDVAEIAFRALEDPHPRVRFFAAQTVGKIAKQTTAWNSTSINRLTHVLDENKAKDPVLRHAVVHALHSFTEESVASLTTNSKHSRLGVVLALRRHRSPSIARFLQDPEAELILEAARAIHDEPIAESMSALAGLADGPIPLDDKDYADSLLRRILNANFRLGGKQHAERVAAVAANKDVAESIRLEALEELKQWDKPSSVDRVIGAWRPIAAQRESKFIADVLRPVLGGIMSGSDKVRSIGASLAAKYGIVEVETLLIETLSDQSRDVATRVASLQAVGSLNSKSLMQILKTSLQDNAPEVRVEARRQYIVKEPSQAISVLEQALNSNSIVEQQGAIRQLASLKSPKADHEIGGLLRSMLDSNLVPIAIQLDVLEAAKARKTKKLTDLLNEWNGSFKKDDLRSQFKVALEGGNTQRGSDVFFGRSAASCRRCHKIGGSGGDVGPDLSKIGKDKKRDYILESIILPSAKIAKGFENISAIMESGRVISGMVKQDTAETLELMQADGTIVTLKKSEIDETVKRESAMPSDMIKHLSKSDIRDLVEFLASQKSEPQKSGHNE